MKKLLISEENQIHRSACVSESVLWTSKGSPYNLLELGLYKWQIFFQKKQAYLAYSEPCLFVLYEIKV